jgi:hypothetical protein
MTTNVEGWSFTVVGCDSSNLPKYLGVTETREEAETLQKNMEAAGWRRVAIFDAAHQEQIQSLQKEVAQKDKTIDHLEDLLKRQQGLGLGRG